MLLLAGYAHGYIATQTHVSLAPFFSKLTNFWTQFENQCDRSHGGQTGSLIVAPGLGKLIFEGSGFMIFGDVKLVTVHGKHVQEAKEETTGRFGGRWWRFDGEDRKTEITF
jgi:hypothetical protein